MQGRNPAFNNFPKDLSIHLPSSNQYTKRKTKPGFPITNVGNDGMENCQATFIRGGDHDFLYFSTPISYPAVLHPTAISSVTNC